MPISDFSPSVLDYRDNNRKQHATQETCMTEFWTVLCPQTLSNDQLFICALQSPSFSHHVTHQKRTINAERERALLVRIGLPPSVCLSVFELKANVHKSARVVFFCAVYVNNVPFYYNSEAVIVLQRTIKIGTFHR